MSLFENQKFINCILFVFFVVLAGFVRVVYPSELIWDFANYHYYNPWALFNNRLGYDIAPAMVNTYFNPLLDIPYYFILNHWPDNPSLVRFFQGGFYGILLFVFYKICSCFFEFKKAPISLVLAIIIGATGYSCLSQSGCSSNEIQVSILILFGFYLIVKHITDAFRKKKIWIYSGLLMGIALGLKPTVITYCIATGLSLIVFMKPLKVSVTEIVIFALSGLVGYLIINGWWMWQLYSYFDNPFFPFLNKIFRSEYYELINFRDDQYVLKTTWLQKLWLPFIISFGSVHDKYVSEVLFFDARFALAYVIFLLLFLKWVFCSRKLSDRKVVFLYAFIIFSYVVWVILFSIMRYVIPIEMLLAIVIVKFFQQIKSDDFLNSAIIISLKIIGIFILLSEIFNYLKIWEIKDVSLIKELSFVDEINLPDNTLIKTYGYPSAFVAARLVKDKDFRIINYANGSVGSNVDFVETTKFTQERELIEQSHEGPVIAIIVHNVINKNSPLARIYNHNANYRKSNLEQQGMFCKTWRTFDEIDICAPIELKEQIFGVNNSNN